MTTGFSQQDSRTITERAAGRCEICGTANPVHIHHRCPRRSGGTTGARAAIINSVPNGLRVCNWCHDRAESNREEALHMGWLVPEGVLPWEWQAYLNLPYGQGWYYLDGDGGYLFAPARAQAS